MTRQRIGPIDDLPWPERLKASVVQPGPHPRIQGFDVERDLAREYSFAEVVLITLTGDAPDRARGRAFEIAMTFLAPISVAEAPSHAAAVARLCGARTSGFVATGAVALAEQARWIVAAHADLLEWLDRPATAFPSHHRTDRNSDADAVRHLRDALPEPAASHAVFLSQPTLMASLLSVVHFCGLTSPDQLEIVLTTSRFAAMASEGLAAEPGSFRTYPANLPAFRYDGGSDEEPVGY